MQRAIVSAMHVTPTHGSFLIKPHILRAAVKLSHFSVWRFYGREVEAEWLLLYVSSVFVDI